VNVNAVGSYTVAYSVTDPSGNSSSATRTVKVVDTTKPVLALTGANPQLVECHTPYPELNATAADTCAGDLTSVIVINSSAVDANTVGSYIVTYDVTDPSGNQALQLSRTVTVLDTTKPVVTLNGTATMTVQCHTSFTDPGASANDTCAGTLPVTVSGSVDASTVNPNAVGSYTVAYDVTDPSGNHAVRATRTVRVVDTTKPVISSAANIITGTDSGQCSAVVNYPLPSASDLCAGLVPVSCNPP